MKKIILASLSLLFSGSGFSQTIIENPGFGFATESNLTIQKIELSDTATVLFFHVANMPNNSIYLPKQSYIQPLNGRDKLYVKSSIGIRLGEKYTVPESGEVDYQLIFPKIDPSANKLDYGEANDGGTWYIYDIRLKDVEGQTIIPKEMLGNWFNKESGEWVFSFMDTLAIYKKKVWNYGEAKFTQGKGSIVLKNKKGNIGLFVQRGNDGTYRIGESPQLLKEYCSTVSALNLKKPEHDEGFKMPVFKNDSATYSGYLKGYTPRMGIKTATAYVDDIITGQQSIFLVNLSDEGTFSIKLPIYYPHCIYVRSGFYNGQIFLEPGKSVFQMIAPGDRKLFMGESAEINMDLSRLEKLSKFNYNEMHEKILDMTPETFKSYFMDLGIKDLNSLDALRKEHLISANAYQVKKMEFEFHNALYILEYNRIYEGEFRAKNKIPESQKTLPYKTGKPALSYYDFITNEMVNNPLAVISRDYDFFLNTLKYHEILRGELQDLTPYDMIVALETSGYTFYKKYKDKVNDLGKEKKGEILTQTMMVNDLIDKGVIFTDEEKVFIKAMKAYENSEASIKRRELQKEYTASLNNFYSKHESFINLLYHSRLKSVRNENLEKLGIHMGLASDIMTAQDESRPITADWTPLTDEKLNTIKQYFTIPFIGEYIAMCNKTVKAKIEANKNKTGYFINQVPKTEADQLFDGLMKKYRGNVVYVDFWATWCSPCRSGIEQIKPLKEEMAKEKVVFVYITNQTSPKQTYENMIPDIKGEHYRVSTDEWNYLCSKFNISGIPHYVLVDKKGAVINPNLSHMGNDPLKRELEKRIKE